MGEAEAVEAKGGTAAEEEGGGDEGGVGGIRGSPVGAPARSRIVVSHPFRKEREKDGAPGFPRCGTRYGPGILGSKSGSWGSPRELHIR